MIFIFLLSSLLIAIITALAFYDRHNQFLSWLFTLALIMVLASIFVALKYPKLGINSSDFAKVRWIGITDHPNKLGGLVLISIWCGVNLFFTKGGWGLLRRSVAAFSIVASAYVVLKADSMTSIVASLVAIISMIYFKLFGRASASVKAVLFVGVGLGGLVMTTFYMNSEEIVNKSLATSGRDTTFTGRSALWERGIQSFTDSPLVGHGFDNLDGLTKKYGIRMSHLHNGYIEVITKGGIVAMAMLLLIILKNFRNLLIIKAANPALFAFLATGFLGILVHNLAESSYLRGLNGLNLMFMLISSFLVVSVNNIDKLRKAV
ncbi:O-antigen ligase family protein [Methylomonas sp. SURF-1]|uniref:O-antigen ligase family protein n=1 Tax=Methylomonas aurea TaxID=2952224 RepID=A0ABT1UN96_9GAMM|nr:O-antigen ligase family protein [Methylomonas sp. SURF-1]MCQ8183169.1 O-antigen ligase family protein [Methylomonas sp. SURF-1]